MEAVRAYHDRTVAIPRYGATGRPVGIMDFVTFAGKPGLYLPVIRYEGLYHDKPQPDSTFCGTFYYYEPESNYYLHLGNCFISACKYHALRSLELRFFAQQIAQFEQQTGIRFDELDVMSRFQLVPNFMSSLYLFKFAEKMTSTMSPPPLIVAEYPRLGVNTRGVTISPTPLFSPRDTPHLDQLLLLFDINRQANILTRRTKEELHRWSTGINQRMDPTQPIFDLVHESAYEVWIKITELSEARRFLTTVAENGLNLNRLKYSVRLVRTINALGLVQPENPYTLNQMYTDSDFMDQTLCKLALHFGYDTILLQREFGKDRIVTEVLDTRPRVESYSSFQFLDRPALRWNQNNPTVWTPDLGFATAHAGS